MKKRRNTRERGKDSGRFVPTGTDKADPKGTSISELDRPEHYRPRQPKPTPEPQPPVEPQPAPVDNNPNQNAPAFPSEQTAARLSLTSNE